MIMKQIYLKHLCMMICLITSMNVFAIDKTIDGINYSLDMSFRTATVTGSSLANIVVPATIESDGVTYTVTDIGNGAFKNSSTIKTIQLSSTITTINSNAFSGSSLQSLDAGNEGKVKSIRESAFWNCTSLQYINLGNALVSIFACAFAV